MHKLHEYTSRMHELARDNGIQMLMTMTVVEDWELKTSITVTHMDTSEVMQSTLALNSIIYDHLSQP